jgi:hypothetical protein
LDLTLQRHKEELHQLGYTIEDIGVHSWRKGAHTYMNCGTTAGPSAAATCVRGGHTMGAVRDIYVLHEKAGDHYCGRIFAGLPVNDAMFAVSHPDFTPVEDNMTEAQLEEARREVDSLVSHALDVLFGDRGRRILTLFPFLKVGLASHLRHRDRLDEVYPLNSPIRFCPLFTSPIVLSLKKYVKITLPWKDGGMAYATGIPPHTTILSNLEEMKALINGLLPAIARCLDDRTMSGNLSEARMREIVDGQNTTLRGEIRIFSWVGSKCKANNGNEQTNKVIQRFSTVDLTSCG